MVLGVALGGRADAGRIFREFEVVAVLARWRLRRERSGVQPRVKVLGHQSKSITDTGC